MFHISYFSDKIRQEVSDSDLLIYFSFLSTLNFSYNFSVFFDCYILDKYLQQCKFNLLLTCPITLECNPITGPSELGVQRVQFPSQIFAAIKVKKKSIKRLSITASPSRFLDHPTALATIYSIEIQLRIPICSLLLNWNIMSHVTQCKFLLSSTYVCMYRF